MANASIIQQYKSNDSVLIKINWYPKIADSGLHNFTITCSDSSCRPPGITVPYTFTYSILVNSAPFIIGKSNLCLGSSALLSAGYTNGLCTWTTPTGAPITHTCLNANCDSILVAPTSTQQYIVQCNANIDCIRSDTFIISIVKDFTISTTDIIICKPVNSIPIKVKATNNNIPLKYQWSPILNIIGNSNTSNILVNTSSAVYTVIVKDTNNCFLHTDSVNVIYDGNFIVSAGTNKNSICLDDTIQLSATGGTVKWIPIYNITNLSSAVTTAYPFKTTTYSALVSSNISTCTDTASVTINVIPVRAQLINDTTITDGDVINIGTPYSICDNDCNYFWYDSRNLLLSNSIDGSSLNPLVRPPGDTWFRLRVNSKNGECTDEDSVLITVKCKDLWMPNAFNPASAIESNRKFGIRNVGVNLNYFRIVNRYGVTVFTTLDPLIKWDGTLNGKPCAMDTYFWMAKGVCYNGNAFIDKGEVILIR